MAVASLGEISEPFHPGKSFQFPKKKYGSRLRSCQAQWFVDYPFLHYDVERDAIFCHVCVKAVAQKKILASRRPDSAFLSTGFCNWKDALSKVKKHRVSEHHKEACEVVVLSKTKSIDELLDIGHASKKPGNRKILLTILENIQFLAKQGLPLRNWADDESKEVKSNFMQLFLLRSIDNSSILEWLSRKNDTYVSKDIQNEIIKLMAHRVLRDIAFDLKQAKFYVVMADEATDISNKEQLVFVFRWVDSNFIAHEEFVGMYQLDKTDAETIYKAIKDVLLLLNLNVHKLRGQCYDGASTMSGSKGGVAKKIKDDEPSALYLHCFGHALNLAAGDSIKRCKILRDSLDTTYELCKLIKFSPRRDALFQKLKEELELDTPGIKKLCPTRWTVRGESLKSVLENYSVLQDFFEVAYDETKDSETRARIAGISAQLSTFNYYFGTSLAQLVLRHCDNLSRTLQNEGLSAVQGQKVAAMVEKTIQGLRSEDSFKGFWDLITMKAEQLDVSEAVLPRRRKQPRRYDDGQSEGDFPSEPSDYYRRIYFEAMDLILQCIADRFDQKDYQIYSQLEQLLLKGCQGLAYDEELKAVRDVYCKDILYDELEVQFELMASQMTDEVSLTAIIDFLKLLSEPARTLFSQVTVLVELLLVLPATNATSERSFSALRRLKSYLRSTMTQLRLNNLLLLHVHQDRLDKIDLRGIGNEFIAASEHRSAIFGSFTS